LLIGHIRTRGYLIIVALVEVFLLLLLIFSFLSLPGTGMTLITAQNKRTLSSHVNTDTTCGASEYGQTKHQLTRYHWLL